MLELSVHPLQLIILKQMEQSKPACVWWGIQINKWPTPDGTPGEWGDLSTPSHAAVRGASSEEMGEVPIAAPYKIVTDTHRGSSSLFLENWLGDVLSPQEHTGSLFGIHSSCFKELLKTAVECFTARNLSSLSWKLHLFWTALFARKIGETARSHLVFN